MKFHKLVRDRIPEIIAAAGKKCDTKILSDEDFLHMLDTKLDEELAEYHKYQNIEELADLLELIYAVTVARGYTLEQLEQVRMDKVAMRGAFQKRIMLKKVYGESDDRSLSNLILTHRDPIIEQLDVNTLATYRWLQDNLHSRNVAVDQEYRRKYGHYYGMRFVSQDYRNCYFHMLEECKHSTAVSFRKISEKLYQVDQKHEFSFITKMLHTIDQTHPIYDSRVAKVLKINRYPQKDLDKVIRRDERILETLDEVYRELEVDPNLGDMLKEIDQRTPNKPMSIEKKIDFILWALGGIIE